MKCYPRFIIGLLMLLLIALPNASADRSEKVWVEKTDFEEHDLIIRRKNGERLLIQHHYSCIGMSRDYPIFLIWDDDELVSIQVKYNKVCKVYNYAPYDGEAVLIDYKKTYNPLIPNYQATITWKDKKYGIEYKPERKCNLLYYFENRTSYLTLNDGSMVGGKFIFPGAKGECKITKSRELGVVEKPTDSLEKMSGIQVAPGYNQVYFHWNEIDGYGDKPWYLISHSQFPLDPSEFKWKQMPNIRFTRADEFTVKRLANERKYYFYMAAMNKKGQVGPWSELTATPVKPAPQVRYDEWDPPEFQISMTEDENYYTLSWPKQDNVRKHWIMFYAGGKRQFVKTIPAHQTEYVIPKKGDYYGKRLRFIVRVLHQKSAGHPVRDSHWWTYQPEQTAQH